MYVHLCVCVWIRILTFLFKIIRWKTMSSKIWIQFLEIQFNILKIKFVTFLFSYKIKLNFWSNYLQYIHRLTNIYKIYWLCIINIIIVSLKTTKNQRQAERQNVVLISNYWKDFKKCGMIIIWYGLCKRYCVW